MLTKNGVISRNHYMLEILKKLGVDYTIFFQITIWILAYIITKKILLDKLVLRIKQRQNATFGSEEETDKILEEASKKEKEYGKLAKALDVEMKEIFSMKLKHTEQEALKKISIAKKETSKSLKQVMTNIEKEKTLARVKLTEQIPEISSLIKEKIF